MDSHKPGALVCKIFANRRLSEIRRDLYFPALLLEEGYSPVPIALISVITLRVRIRWHPHS